MAFTLDPYNLEPLLPPGPCRQRTPCSLVRKHTHTYTAICVALKTLPKACLSVHTNEAVVVEIRTHDRMTIVFNNGAVADCHRGDIMHYSISQLKYIVTVQNFQGKENAM